MGLIVVVVATSLIRQNSTAMLTHELLYVNNNVNGPKYVRAATIAFDSGFPALGPKCARFAPLIMLKMRILTQNGRFGTL